jgi:hypothetical protein
MAVVAIPASAGPTCSFAERVAALVAANPTATAGQEARLSPPGHWERRGASGRQRKPNSTVQARVSHWSGHRRKRSGEDDELANRNGSSWTGSHFDVTWSCPYSWGDSDPVGGANLTLPTSVAFRSGMRRVKQQLHAQHRMPRHGSSPIPRSKPKVWQRVSLCLRLAHL